MNYSKELSSLFDRPCWFHGTDQNFANWVFPPPPKPGNGLLVPHSAVFFATDRSFAGGAGKRLAVVSLSPSAKILDATADYDAAEKLRKAVAKNYVASMSSNTEHDFWHQGWKTGDVLRFTYRNPKLAQHLGRLVFEQAAKAKMSRQQAEVVVGLNTARALIELICVEAKSLGFDALYGHEVDRHSKPGVVQAQPWLAVFRADVVSAPQWT